MAPLSVQIARTFPSYMDVKVYEIGRGQFKVVSSHRLNNQFVKSLFPGFRVLEVFDHVCVLAIH